MKLIDNRYKIEKVLKDNLYGSTYEVIDFGIMIKDYP